MTLRCTSLVLLTLFCVVARAQGQNTFTIASAAYGTVASSTVPAGVNGALLTLSGTLPSAAQQAAAGYLGCFYTGYGNTAGFTLSAPNADGTEPLTVPASTIQSIPAGKFTAANGYSVTALLYFIASGGSCDGTVASAESNQFPVQIVAPSLGTYAGPINVPQTNSATGVQAAPLALTLPASGFLTGAASGGTTSLTFGTFGSITPLLSGSTLYVPVPAAFSSSPVGTTASLSICNNFTGGSTVCTTPVPAITFTITALVASAGGLTATPTPVQTAGQTVLTAQFSKSPSAAAGVNPGAPSGAVTFVAPGQTLAPARLVLDTTAAFATQTTTIAAARAPAPVILPAAGAYTGAQTISITDSASNAAIYYTLDGSQPTTSSTPYTGPFSISTSESVSAIGAIPGDLNSAVTVNRYQITIRPATQLAYQVQPGNAVLNTAIAPALQVAVEDATGAVVTNSTAPVTVGLYSDPNNGVLSGTLTVNAVNGIATFSDLKIDALGTAFSIRAYSGTLTAVISNPFNVTPPAITMTVQSELVGIGSTLNGGFTLGAPAPTGGLTVNLSSGTPANVTIAPATVTVAAGQTTGAFTYTGVAAGDSTLKATATNYQNGTVLTTGTAAQVSLGMIPNVAPAQMQSLALSLATAAPAGGTTVTFTIANTNIATVTQSIFIPAGQQTPATNPQVTGVLIGTTTVTANAPGYAPATRPVNVTVVATVNPATTTINLTTSTNTILQISAPAPPGGITFKLTSDDPTIATVPATVTLVKGATSANLTITGVKDGTTTIRATSAGVAEADGTVTVNSKIASSTYTTGYDLETYSPFYLPVTPSNPVTVTVTSNDPTIVSISNSNTVVGQKTLTYPNTTSNYVATIWYQGLKVGTTTLTISAPGYTSGTETVTVDPSGFVYYGTPNFSTTTYSQPNGLTMYLEALNPSDLTVQSFGYYINPGSPTITVPVTSSATNIGTVPANVVFKPNDSQESFNFQPVAAGTTNINIGTPPAGFSVPSQYQQVVATVTTPAITPYAQTSAVHLMQSIGIYLPVAPPSPVTVTVSLPDTTIASISSSATVIGTKTVTFTNVSSTTAGTVYIQGQSAGSVTVTESAPGYTSGTATYTVQPSGFFLGYPFTSFSTTTFSQPTVLNVYTSGLDPSTLNLSSAYLEVSPGVAPFNVGLTDSATSVGTLSANSVTFNPGENQHSVTFTPVAAGTATITLVTPAGFSTPANYQSNVATVTAPSISINNATTGVHLENTLGIYLPVTPPNPVTVTVTISDPTVTVLSTSGTVTGTSKVTFTNVTSTNVGTIYLQGLAVGSATITESAPGYTTGTSTITVHPSGFTFYYQNPTFTTTTFSSATQLPVYTTTYTPGSLNVEYVGLPLSPGVGPVTINVTDSAPSVGTISASTLVYNTGDTTQAFNFKPVSAGTANLAISTPSGFSTGSQYQAGTVTVTAPIITIGNVTTGVNLDYSMQIYLPQTPPNPVTVTVTSSGPLIGTISKDPTVVGTSSVTFTNVTSTNVGMIYVQGQGLGTAQLTETAAGYTNGSSTLTVDPSGFVGYGNPTFTTSVGNGDTSFTVYASALNPGTLTVEQFGLGINPGIGNVSVPVTSSNTAVGTITNSPLVFMPGVGSLYATFHAVASGTSTITIATPTTTGFSTPSQYTTGTATVQ